MNASEAFAACLQELIRAGTKQNYRPLILIELIDKRGPVGAAKILLHAPNPQVGLNRLVRLGLVEMSVEACVVKPEHRGLFSQDEVAEATRRLEDTRKRAIKKPPRP